MATCHAFVDAAGNTHFSSTDYETVRYIVMFVPGCGVVSSVLDCTGFKTLRTDWAVVDKPGKSIALAHVSHS